MTVTIAGILCQEVVHDYSENYDALSGPTAQKIYTCSWADRFTVIHGILGASSTSHVGGLVTLNYPMAFPELAAESTNVLASMYARNVVCTGVGPPVQGTYNIAFTLAKITVNFGPYPWTFSGIDYFQVDPTNPYIWVEQHISSSAEYTTVPGSNVYVNPGGGVVPFNAQWGFFDPIREITLTLKNCPYLPVTADSAALVAPYNSVTYLGAPPGQLAYAGMDDSRTQASDGTQTAEITFSFKYRALAPWDYVYYKGAWLQITNSRGGAIIPRSDLSTVIPSSYIA